MDSILVPPSTLDALTSAGAKQLRDDLTRGWHAKSVVAIERQARIAAAFQAARPLHNEALGQLVMVVDQVLFEEMRREHGAKCWMDKTFRKEFAGRNPECAIRSKSRKTMLQVNGLARSSRSSRSGEGSADARTGGNGARLFEEGD